MILIENRLLCHPVHFLEIPEDDQIFKCGCLSLLDENSVEQMIFLSKNDDTTEYKVRIYKAHPADAYVSNIMDKGLKSYEENAEFADFIFVDFFFARDFIMTLRNNHPEYRIRPVVKK